MTIVEADDLDDRHRLALRRVTIPPGVEYVIVVGSSLEPVDEELESLRGILSYLVPLSLVIAGIGGWFLAGRSLSPVVAMADRARKIGVESLNARLPVANPRDELGRLAGTFNELLARLQASVEQQRQFMADASHELRTPVTIARTAARVALQQPTRTEAEYRETLEIVEQETIRLSRIVDDMFTLTRADAGNYPVRTTPMYLDEVVDEVVRAARVVAATRDVSITVECLHSAAFTGDEELIRRLIVNVLDNAIRYSPAKGTVRVALDREATSMRSQSTIRGRESPRRRRRGFSSASIESTRRARTTASVTAAPGLDWPWHVGLPTCTAAMSGSRLRRAWDQPSSSHCLSAPKPAPQSYFTEGVVSSISAFPLLFVVNVPTCFASMKTV